jgi:hypothetical protein
LFIEFWVLVHILASLHLMAKPCEEFTMHHKVRCNAAVWWFIAQCYVPVTYLPVAVLRAVISAFPGLNIYC